MGPKFKVFLGVTTKNTTRPPQLWLQVCHQRQEQCRLKDFHGPFQKPAVFRVRVVLEGTLLRHLETKGKPAIVMITGANHE